MNRTAQAQQPESGTSPLPLKSGRFHWLLPVALPLAFYLVVAAAFTWPLVLHLGDRVMLSGSGDVWQHLWNNWWMRFSLLTLHTQPYTTPMLFHPAGANLYFHALDPLDGYLSLPWQLLFGLVAAFNLGMLFQVTLAGYGTYLLARYLTGRWPAALVAGLIYACSPLEARLLNLGQLELTAIEWLPFYILCFIKALNRDNRPWLWRGLSVLFLLLLSLTTWYYLLYAALFSGLFFLYRLWQERAGWRKRWPGTLAITAGIFVVYGLLISPVLLPTLREAGSGGTAQPIFNVIYNSTTLKGLFATGPSLLWGLFGSGENDEFRGNFLGFVALALALLGLAGQFKKTWFWGLTGLIFIVLALGPVLHISFDPDWTPKTAESGLTLPGRWLYYLPFGNIARVPLRYTLVTMLALAVMAAYGLAWLERQLEDQKPFRLALPLAAGLLVFLEFMPGSRPLVDTSIPAFYNRLANEGQWNDFAVLETPDRGDASIISRAMYFQTAHRHPIVGGYLSRKPAYPFRDFPGIEELLTFPQLYQRDILPRASLRNAIGVLQYYKIRYVILHPELLKDEDSRFSAREVLQAVFGAETSPYYQDSQLQVWRVPDAPLAAGQPDAAKILPQLAEGWDRREDSPQGVERLVPRQARLALFNPYNQPLALRVQVKARATRAGTSLLTTFNGQPAGERPLDLAASPLSYDLTLQPGLNEVLFKGSGPLYFGELNFANR